MEDGQIPRTETEKTRRGDETTISKLMDGWMKGWVVSGVGSYMVQIDQADLEMGDGNRG